MSNMRNPMGESACTPVEPPPRARRYLGRAFALMLAVAVTTTAMTGTAASADPPRPGTPDLGMNVTVFDPGMPVGEIQAALDATHATQVDNEMGTQRYAFLFKPGTYGTA